MTFALYQIEKIPTCAYRVCGICGGGGGRQLQECAALANLI